MNLRLLAGWKTRLHALCLCALVSMMAVTAAAAQAQEAAAPVTSEVPLASTTAAEAVAEPVAAAVDAAEAVAEKPAAADPVVEKGDVAWMLTSTLLVLLMVVPGLALFYGGMVRSKNVLSVLVQVAVVFSLMVVLWIVYGYSLAFSGEGAWIGNFDKLFLKGVTIDTLAATFTEGVALPEYVFLGFQATFAGITGALIVGAFAERAKLAAVLLFAVIWFTFGYLPIAHMVWATGGFLFEKGALDFAGGTVVHINAGVAGLVGAYFIGKRLGYGQTALKPHNVTLTFVGASLLWVGWFGFNAGSNLEANGVTAVAFINTFVATAAAALSWSLVEQVHHGKPSMLGAATGAVAGLVAITPASGFAAPMTSIALGLIVSPICYVFVSTVKNKLKYDDTLDVFGVHCVGGIVGAIATGIVADPALGGQGFFDYTQFPAGVGAYDMGAQVITQIKAVLLTLVYSGLGSAVLFFIVDKIFGLRPTEEAEREGLDLTEHGERAYNY